LKASGVASPTPTQLAGVPRTSTIAVNRTQFTFSHGEDTFG